VITYDFHPEARVDLDEIWDFIAEDSFDAADKVIAEILASIDVLVPFPNQGHERPDLTSRSLRSTVVQEYLIAYAPDQKPLWIIAVMHGRRSPRVMAAILEAESSLRSQLHSGCVLPTASQSWRQRDQGRGYHVSHRSL
jgi:toxin ParE1/3/4